MVTALHVFQLPEGHGGFGDILENIRAERMCNKHSKNHDFIRVKHLHSEIQLSKVEFPYNEFNSNSKS